MKPLKDFKTMRLHLIWHDGLSARERPVDGAKRGFFQRVADDVIVQHGQRVTCGQSLDGFERRRR